MNPAGRLGVQLHQPPPHTGRGALVKHPLRLLPPPRRGEQARAHRREQALICPDGLDPDVRTRTKCHRQVQLASTSQPGQFAVEFSQRDVQRPADARGLACRTAADQHQTYEIFH
jgi:hypothetical protein